VNARERRERRERFAAYRPVFAVIPSRRFSAIPAFSAFSSLTDTHLQTAGFACAQRLDTMVVMRANQVIRNISLSLVVAWGVVTWSRLPAQSTLGTDPLTQAQIDNQRAQATYYQRQADKRGFWRTLREYGGPIGATVAAVVAIASFGLNYRATLRSRADAKYYEALTLFGDRSNPTVRSSAAGLLEQMGSTKRRYFETSFNQLCVGLLAEQHDNTRDSIRNSLGRLVERDPARALAKLEAVNRSLRDAMAESLCRFCVARGVKSIEQLTDTIWAEIEEVTGYDRAALTGLLETIPKDNLTAALNAARREFHRLGKADDDAERTRLESGEAAERLRSNIKSFSEAVLLLDGRARRNFLPFVRTEVPKSLSFAFLVGAKFRDLRRCLICRSVLRDADFTSANLERARIFAADLSNANLTGAKLLHADCRGAKLVNCVLKQADLTAAKFQNVDLTGADLTAARFRNTSIVPAAFERTEWWKADFRQQRDLLRAVYSKYKKNLPELEDLYVRGDIHQSVLDLIGKITEERV
jgi:uncharacterized protein YjbI with pentapeptide repeats